MINIIKDELKNKKADTFGLMEQENKVVALSDKNRVFYFGTNSHEIKNSKSLQLKTDKVIWIKFLEKKLGMEDVAQACKEYGDVYIQQDGPNSFYIEFQTIYGKTKKIRDMILGLQEKFEGLAKVKAFASAEKYKSKY